MKIAVKLLCVAALVVLAVSQAEGARAFSRGHFNVNQTAKGVRAIPMSANQLGSYDHWTGYKYCMYAYATYCSSGSLSSWNCYVCNSDTSTSFSILSFMTYSPDDLFGYVGYDAAAGQIIVAFRGTVALDIENWVLDLKSAIPVAYPPVSGANVGDGFYKGYMQLQSQLDAAMAQATSSYPSAPIVVTGHSLGAALATLATAHLATNYPASSISLYTFGCPRVGDSTFASWFGSLGLATAWRVVNDDDLVPHVPLLDFGWHHTATEVWYTTPTAYTVCNGSGEDPNCSDSAILPISVSDHLHYYGVYEDCSS